MAFLYVLFWRSNPDGYSHGLGCGRDWSYVVRQQMATFPGTNLSATCWPITLYGGHFGNYWRGQFDLFALILWVSLLAVIQLIISCAILLFS
jgi:hypothetical protein